MFPLRLTSFLPEVPSSRLAPEDREPCDSRRPLLPEKSENIKFVSSVWNIGNYSEDEQHEKFCLNWIPQLLPKAKQLKKKKKKYKNFKESLFNNQCYWNSNFIIQEESFSG